MAGDGYVSIWDRVWTDDLGGNLAGAADRVFIDDFSKVPVVGPAAARSGEILTRMYEGTNRIYSWGISAAPAGVETLDWATTAGQITPGQTAMASAVKLGKQVPGLSVIEPATKIIEKWDPENPVLTDEFNLRTSTEEERKRVFEESGPGKVISGGIDTGVQFFLDPLVIVGKGIKIARFGGKIAGIYEVSGITNRTISSAKMVAQVGDEADTALDIALGNITGTRDNTLGIFADEIVRSNANDLLKVKQFKNNPNRDILASIGGSINNKEDAIIFIAAAAGNSKYIQKLHDAHHSAYDALTRANKPNLAEVDEFRRPIGDWGNDLRDTAREKDINVGMLLQDLATRNDALAKATGVIVGEGDALLRNIGMADSGITALGAQVASTWRGMKAAGRNAGTAERFTGIDSQTKIGGARKSGVSLSADEVSRLQRKQDRLPNGTGPAIAEHVFQNSAFNRAVRVWDWVGGYHASGMVDTRGPNVGKAGNEIHAALTDSKTIRRDRAFVIDQMNLFLNAVDHTAKLSAVRQIEENVIKKLMADKGVTDRDAVDELYKKIDERRSKALKQFQERGFGVDENNELIQATPQLISQLETSTPMLDMRVLEKSMDILKRAEYQGGVIGESVRKVAQFGGEYSPIAANAFEELQSVWKIGVLLRLGYTQRNVAEGWLRSAAALGTIPAFKHMPSSAKNFVVNSDRRVRVKQMRSIKRSEKNITAQYNENLAKIKATKSARMQKKIQAENNLLLAQMDDLVANRRALQQRDFIGSKPNEYGYNAFSGDLGNMYRKMASNESTVDKALRSEWQRESKVSLSRNNWVKVNPGDKQYWDELATSIRQFRSDPVATLALDGMSAQDMAIAMAGPDFKTYVRDMELETADQIAAHAVKINSMVNRYLPTEQVRVAAAAEDVAPEQLRMMLGQFEADKRVIKVPDANKFVDDNGVFDSAGFDAAQKKYKDLVAKKGSPNTVLSPIHGKDVAKNLLRQARLRDIYDVPANFAFKVIGTLPESRLVRQPFYAEVWNREFNRIVDIVKKQGGELDPATLERINKNSHTVAMRAVNETLYTIERYSNVAAMARYVSPFFPAWENSAKVWLGLVAKDPSILPRASILWNIPNNMGLVVDEKGEKVGQERWSFLTGAQDRYIILPESFNDEFKKYSGGVPFKVAQGGINVVTPGETPYTPGFGPSVPFAAGLVLQSKPDLQAVLKEHLPEGIWGMIAPLGTIRNDLVESFLPTSAKNLIRWWQGESDTNFLQTLGSIVQSSMVNWNIGGADEDMKPTAEEMVKKTQGFFVFKFLASMILPFSLTRESEYQLELDAWREIQSDPNDTRTFQQKQDAFLATYGDEFLPLTTSTSEYSAGYFNPSQNNYKIIRDHGDLINSIAADAPDNPQLVGMIMSTAPLGEFDESVYKWLGENNVPGTNDTWRSKPNAMNMINSIEMQAAWREYNAMKAERDDALAAIGVKSINAKAAAEIKAGWDYFTGTMMYEKYKEPWLVAFQTYTDMSAANVVIINKVLADEKFMGEYGNTDVWGSVREYMDMRSQAVQAIANGEDREFVNEVFSEWAAGYKDTNYQFADFWDKYLENDSLSAKVGG
jgi:hypothetical protein